MHIESYKGLKILSFVILFFDSNACIVFVIIALVGMELEPLHCVIENDNGEVTLIPVGQAMCCVNGAEVSGATLLTHGIIYTWTYC